MRNKRNVTVNNASQKALRAFYRSSVHAIAVRLRAESPVINSAGQRPANGTPHIYQALKGRNPAVRSDFALSGLNVCRRLVPQGVALCY
jgi:hypothetical protein